VAEVRGYISGGPIGHGPDEPIDYGILSPGSRFLAVSRVKEEMETWPVTEITGSAFTYLYHIAPLGFLSWKGHAE